VQRFQGGLVFKAHRRVYHSTLGLRVIKKKKKEVDTSNSPGKHQTRERCRAMWNTPRQSRPDSGLGLSHFQVKVLKIKQGVPSSLGSVAGPSSAGSQFENNYFTEMCSGSEAGSYLRLIDVVYHSTLGLKVIQKKKKIRTVPRSPLSSAAGTTYVFQRLLPESQGQNVLYVPYHTILHTQLQTPTLTFPWKPRPNSGVDCLIYVPYHTILQTQLQMATLSVICVCVCVCVCARKRELCVCVCV